MDGLGIDTADIGLPGAGPHVAADVERLAREIVDGRLPIAPNCAARTVAADIRPVAEIAQRTGLPIECCTFIGSSADPPVRRGLDARPHAPAAREEAMGFAVGEGLTVMFVTEDTTRARPEDAAAPVHHGHPRRRLAHLRRRHGRPRHAGGARRASCASCSG